VKGSLLEEQWKNYFKVTAEEMVHLFLWMLPYLDGMLGTAVVILLQMKSFLGITESRDGKNLSP
jgi:hypothetical protein